MRYVRNLVIGCGLTAVALSGGASVAFAQCDTGCDDYELAPIPPEPIVEPIYEDPEAMTPPLEGRDAVPVTASSSAPGVTPEHVSPMTAPADHDDDAPTTGLNEDDGSVLPETGGENTIAVLAGALLLACGLSARRIARHPGA